MPRTRPPTGSVSISDIARELSCSIDRATQIMRMELPHVDIRSPGARKACWRAKRKDFEAWLQAREHQAGMVKIEEFSRKYMRGGSA